MTRSSARRSAARAATGGSTTASTAAATPVRTPELDAFAEDFEDRHGLPVERLYVAKLLYGLTTLAEEGAFAPGTTVAAVSRPS